jgi:hypothetical protein
MSRDGDRDSHHEGRRDRDRDHDRRRHRKHNGEDDGDVDDSKHQLKDRHDRRDRHDDKKRKRKPERDAERRDRHHRDRERDRDLRKDRKRGDDDDGSSDRSHRRKKKRHRREHNKDSDSVSVSDHRKRVKKDKKSKSHKSSSRSKSSENHHHRKKKPKKDSNSSNKDGNKSRSIINPPDRSTLIPMGDKYGRTPDPKLDAENDYFSYHQQFWVYLYREEGIAFNDLSTKDAHSAFRRFVLRYNAGDLEVPYYEGLPNDVIEEGKTTKHSWNFKTSEKEREGLEALQMGVRRQTEYKETPDKTNQYCEPVAADGRSNRPTTSSLSEDHRERRRMTPEERQQQRQADRRMKERVQVAQEELTGIGRGDFRERQMEKKRQQSERMHGAAREKGEGEMLDDTALYGDDGRSAFQSALEREKIRKDEKREQRENRIEELQRKEEERKQNMLKMLGLDGVKEKIKISPRKEG